MPDRDPRRDPQVGDIVRIRNKVRRVTSVGVCAQGRPRVCYEQITTKGLSSELKRWQKGTKYAEILYRKQS